MAYIVGYSLEEISGVFVLDYSVDFRDHECICLKNRVCTAYEFKFCPNAVNSDCIIFYYNPHLFFNFGNILLVGGLLAVVSGGNVGASLGKAEAGRTRCQREHAEKDTITN